MKLWIARDKIGYCKFFEEKPLKKEGWFEPQPQTKIFVVSGTLFPELTFENSPQEVKLTLCNNE